MPQDCRDEIGYLTVSANGAKLFFQVINSRYGRASTVLTSNKGFEEWGEILPDEVMANTRQSCSLSVTSHRCSLPCANRTHGRQSVLVEAQFR